ncbi:MAG TPA: hypothetical protein VHO48_12230, partial [Anaerolineaceae bacterium]|nr:hypothetical protein [Anaerolineaceae bacterium]
MARIPNRTGQPSTSTRETERWQRQIQNNLPLVGGWLRVEAARLLDQAARQGSGQATLVLALAYASSPDQRVRDLALDSLESIHKQTCMDAVWLAWIETRSTKLLQFLLDKNWIANAPPKARVYSALRLGKPDLLVRGQINYVAPLIEACRDAYPDLANQARECLRNLHEPEAIDVFCETWARDRS